MYSVTTDILFILGGGIFTYIFFWLYLKEAGDGKE